MLIFDDTELMLARGKYSTLNAERRELLKQLQPMLDKVVGMPHRILQAASADQRTGYDARLIVSDLAQMARQIDGMLMRVEEIDKQREAIKPSAWPK